ncbi:MAG: S9 family peptidase [Bacteroidales bacterium]|jgi:dipeptidyl aminopeptidase/acylaminoacyl peptidase
MKKIILFLLSAGMMITSCDFPKNQNSKNNSDNQKIIGNPELNLKSDLITPEVLWAFSRINDVTVSPDKKSILFSVTYYDIPMNKGNRELYTMSIDGKDKKQITHTAANENNPLWRPDGKKIGFISAESGSSQIWEMNADGSDRKQISNIENDITGFKYSPDQKKILYVKEVPELVKKVKDVYPDLPKSDGRVITDIMYRHWDTWKDSYSHVFVADFDGNKLINNIDIMKGEEFDCPNKPFSGMEDIAWSPDSKKIVYSCVKKKGKEYALSTNSDLYIYNLQTKTTENITNGMLGYDVEPSFSPDGKKLAWSSMERNGFESDKRRLFVLDFEKKSKTYYTKDFDQNAENICWSEDGKNIYFISDWHATDEIYKLNLETGMIKKITQGIHNYISVTPVGDKLIATQQSMSKPKEIFSVNSGNGNATELSFINKSLLDKLTMGEVKERWVKTTDNKQMQVWVIYPPHFDKNKKYPALLYCEGGPQSTVSQFWSYRWNFQIMAANGYIIVAPNRRGLPGFGQEWLEQISGDYGGQNMKDYLSAIDDVAKEPYINKDKLGAVGASYGGFSVYWLAGNHKKRFKAFIAHDGIFNLEAQYLQTEELWFVNWDLGGPFWDKENKIAQKSYSTSPHKFVQNWDTPIMIVHGELDYRITVDQGMQAFNAAVLKGIPAKFLYFPSENHWVLRPQDAILWQREFFSWLDKWLK